jgi:2-methylcitrate dehydratase PrpD
MFDSVASGGRVTIDRAAAFVATLRWSALPQDIKDRARLAFIDSIGTMLGGLATRSAQIAAAAAHDEAMEGPSIVALTGRGSSRAMAAFANAVAASALDFDDGHYLGGSIHPGAPIVAALLSASEKDTLVTDLLCSQVAAYEVGIRTGYLLWPRHPGDRRHTCGTSAAVGAAAGVARMLGADTDGIARAVQIAWSHAPMAGLQLPMGKEAIGWASATAVFAGLLSCRGFLGHSNLRYPAPGLQVWPPSLFDDPNRGADPFVESLGTRFESAHTYFKPYPACRYTHSAIDGVAELMRQHALRPADIAKITVDTHKRAAWLCDATPAALEHAQYSFPFVIGALVVEGAVTPEVIADARLGDKAILDVANRVTVLYDPKLDVHYPARYPNRVTLELRSGETLTIERVKALGDSDLPMSEADLVGKYRGLASSALGDEAADRLLTLLQEPTNVAVGQITDLIASKRRNTTEQG